MESALSAGALAFGFIGLGVLSYALVIILDQTRKLDADKQATWPSRFYQCVMMYAFLMFALIAVLAVLNGEKWTALGFLVFVTAAAVALFPALFRKQCWDDRNLIIEWPFGRRTEIPWVRVSSARATNFPESIVIILDDGSKNVLWTEHHFGLANLVDKLFEKLGDQLSVGMFSNLYSYYQDRFG